jgi:PHP family Zn ribbon phosphoesterase
MTPGNIAGMAAICGLSIIAVSDHNTCRQCPAVLAAAQEHGLLAIPAMELTTAEEAHILCLLPDLDAALAFSDYVYARLPDIENRPDIFGEQTLTDRFDNPVGVERKLLMSATSISVYDTAALLKGYGGVAVPAHIDRPSFSVLANLGLWDPAMGFTAFEIWDTAGLTSLEERFPDLKNLRCLTDSDAHTLERLAAKAESPGDIDIDRPTAGDFIKQLTTL